MLTRNLLRVALGIPETLPSVRHHACPSTPVRRFMSSTSSSSTSTTSTWRGKLRIGGGALGLASLAVVGLALIDGTDGTSIEGSRANDAKQSSSSISAVSMPKLIRSYLVWSVLGLPSIVDASPGIMDALFHSAVPGVQGLTESLVRWTFFDQFIPGQTAVECIPAMEALRRRNVGSALNYSAEADTMENLDLREIEVARLLEVERALDVLGALEQRMAMEGWARGSSAFALKVTGLIDPAVLARASVSLHRMRVAHHRQYESIVPYPGCPSDNDAALLMASEPDTTWVDRGYAHGVSKMGVQVADQGVQPGDLEKLRTLWDRLDSLADRARRNGVRLILDAEESYYEAALDGYVRLLSMKYNRPYTPDNHLDKPSSPSTGPVIYGSYQCYLARQPDFLQAAIKHAADNGYALGLKLVRGGYIVKEQANWVNKEGPAPVWPEKSKTDACYNGSIQIILETLNKQLRDDRPDKALSVIFGTHNIDSLTEIFERLQSEGLASQTSAGKLRLCSDAMGRVNIAQLYGMRDDLSDKIHNAFEESRSPMSMIFIAYGRLRETMPFLGRRAVENKSLLGGNAGAAVERRRVGAELRRRLTFGLL